MNKVRDLFVEALAMTVGMIGAAVLIACSLMAFFAALWPLWLSACAVAVAGHFIGWW